MNLDTLREKISGISKKHAEDTSTINITESVRQLVGKDPQIWLEFIEEVKEKVQFDNQYNRHNFLSDLYEKAFQDTESLNYKNNEAYAHLFVSYARLKSQFMSDDAQMIFNQARSIVRKFAVVHLASAQFELERDNYGKAKKILEHAVMFKAWPVEDLQVALQKLKDGQDIIFEHHIPKEFTEQAHCKKGSSSGSDSSGEIKSAKQLLDPCPGRSVRQPRKLLEAGPPQRAQGMSGQALNAELPAKTPIFPIKTPLPMRREDLPGKMASTPLDSSHHKSGLRHFRSTPVLGSEKKRNTSFGLPARVKKSNLRFSAMNEAEEEGDMNTMECFKPIHTHPTNVSGMLNNHGGGHTSGYHSMLSDSSIHQSMDSQPSEPPVPIKEEVKVSPVASVSLPNPVVRAPLVERTPDNYQPSTPMASMDVITVNDDQYGVLGVIGKGGSSKVYQVLDCNHKVKAIKVVNLNNANDIIIEGYKNEIKLLKRLQYCDKVIKMYDSEYKANENLLYVVMEWGSEDLASFFRSQIKNKKILSDNLVCFYWEFMLEAVQALHKEGIIHSDLKPANFLLVGGNMKLIDFGIAKALQQDKTSVILETQIGTLNYMSPEAIVDSCGDTNDGKPKFKIGVKSDVWSLGCILYNMVYGRTPFGHLRQDIFKLQAIINPDFPMEFPEKPNKHLMDVMKRCLNRDPKLRPSIDELLAHPYLQANKKEAESPAQDKLNGKMEELVKTLAMQYALSPGGVRSVISQTMDKSNTSGNSSMPKCGAGPKPPHNLIQKPHEAGAKPPHSLIQKPEGPTYKQLKAPQCAAKPQTLLSSHVFKPAGT